MKRIGLLFIGMLMVGSAIGQDQIINGKLFVNETLDVREKSLFKLKSVLARLPEGGDGTYLGVKSYFSQLTEGVTKLSNVKSFAIEHLFHGRLNSTINFYRGGSEIGGSLGISVYDGTEYFRFTKAKLEVNGIIRAKEVKIESTGWSDFVFADNYKLPTLMEVESHINEHKHLPDIPSEKEILENGISVGEMQAKLLQKIEELTLYVIDLKKENDTIRKELNELKR